MLSPGGFKASTADLGFLPQTAIRSLFAKKENLCDHNVSICKRLNRWVRRVLGRHLVQRALDDLMSLGLDVCRRCSQVVGFPR